MTRGGATDMETKVPSRVGGMALAAVALVAVLALAARSPAASAAPILPFLVADPPSNTSLAVDTSTGKAQLLLRFNGYVHNKGPGALDFRGRREAPKVSKQVMEEAERAASKEEGLPQKTEEELAVPAMNVFQRLFTTNEQQTNIERAHVDEASSGEMVYVSADGHHHWHLNHVARYSLWNASKTAEVAPAMKVGFCLEDSQHVETSIGPSSPVYADNVAPYRDFCQQYHPYATSLFEGISAGWRDLYSSNLAFQWVNASNVLPGEYWLREDINPLGFVKEASGTKPPAYAASATVIPGFDAQPKTAFVSAGQQTALTLTSKAYSDSATPAYKIVSAPAHGSLGTINGGKVTYAPAAGYTGPDSFTFSAADPNSQFPESPAVATVSLEVGETTQPGVTIEGAPASMTAGSSVQLTAHVVNDSPEVKWTASAGQITTAGLYTAPSEPPAGGHATVTATTSKGAKAEVSIEITPAAGSKGLLAGDPTATYAVSDQTTGGREEAFQFTAKSSGTVEELLFRTNATANTGVTSLVEAVFAENAGKPGAVLGKASVTGTPATSSWIRASGLSVAVTAGTKYWLVALPVGSGKLHYNAAVNSGGTGNVESTAGGLTTATAESSWETFNQGPVGFQAIGTVGEASPSVSIEGAPAEMVGGTSVQLKAHVVNDSSEVKWTASAGSITAGGLYTAPTEPPVGGRALITVTTQKGAKAETEILITAPQPSVTIEGAPASMTTGSSVQLKAHVVNDSPEVKWTASAGQITTAGLYTAPSEPPAGGHATVTATTSKGAKAEVSIEITAAGTKTLLAGDATATYAVSDQTTAGREEAFQFTAKSSGMVEELLFRTNATANTGVTSLVLAVFAENAGKPGEVLGKASVSGTPATSSWIKASGLSVAVTAGAKYWLVALPVGSGKLHFNAAVTSGGTGNVESTAGGLTTATAESSWETYNQGPAGFQAVGRTSGGSALATAASLRFTKAGRAHPRRPRMPLRNGRPAQIAIAGAPEAMLAATTVQLSALVTRGHGRVRWSASAGTVTASGLFTTPAAVPRGGTVRISARYPGAHTATLTLRVLAQSSPRAAPSAPLPSGADRQGLLSRPQTELFDGEVLVTTYVGGAGRLHVTVSSATRQLGACTVSTSGHMDVTCRLPLRGRGPVAMSVAVGLSAGGRSLAARTATGAIPIMSMTSGLPLGATTRVSPLDFLCSPQLANGGALSVTR
jgi:hypothetical protein